MVLTLMIPLRRIFRYEAIITGHVLDNVAKTMVLTGFIVGLAYGTEYFIAWYSHNPVEWESFRWRALGDYAYGLYFMILCNVLIPSLFLFKAVRRSIPWLFGISLVVNFGMWWERFVIIVGGVAHDFAPHSWGLYAPRIVEYCVMVGSFSLFFFLFLLFCKHLPSVSMTEMKETARHAG
jgi:molybdopterin-containing oxidoreductase family membrane subunit